MAVALLPRALPVLAGFATALLTAAGAEAAAGVLGRRPARALVAAAAGALLLSRGLAGQGIDEVSAQSLPIYDSVRSAAAAHGAGPLLELPLADRSGHGLEREAMLGSTRHWLPLVSGLTGYPAAHRDLLQSVIDRLPAAEAVHELVDMTHVRWLLLRPSADWSDAWVREELLRLPDLEIVLERDGWALARVVYPPGAERPLCRYRGRSCAVDRTGHDPSISRGRRSRCPLGGPRPLYSARYEPAPSPPGAAPTPRP